MSKGCGFFRRKADLDSKRAATGATGADIGFGGFCPCEECKTVQGFMRTGDQSIQLELNKNRRQHLHQVCDAVGGLSHTSIPGAEPKTLTITKIGPSTPGRQSMPFMPSTSPSPAAVDPFSGAGHTLGGSSAQKRKRDRPSKAELIEMDRRRSTGASNSVRLDFSNDDDEEQGRGRPATKKQKKPCRCGSAEHSMISHRDCPLNKKRKSTLPHSYEACAAMMGGPSSNAHDDEDDDEDDDEVAPMEVDQGAEHKIAELQRQLRAAGLGPEVYADIEDVGELKLLLASAAEIASAPPSLPPSPAPSSDVQQLKQELASTHMQADIYRDVHDAQQLRILLQLARDQPEDTAPADAVHTLVAMAGCDVRAAEAALAVADGNLDAAAAVLLDAEQGSASPDADIGAPVLSQHNDARPVQITQAMARTTLLVDDGHHGAERLRDNRPNQIVQKLREKHKRVARMAGLDDRLQADRADKLALGDYWWVRKEEEDAHTVVLACVERKTVVDLVSRSHQGSKGAAHSRQLRRLNACGLEKVFFLVEGDQRNLVKSTTVYDAPLPGHRQPGRQIDDLESMYCEFAELLLSSPSEPTRLLESVDNMGTTRLLTAISLILAAEPPPRPGLLLPEFDAFSRKCRSQIQTLPRTQELQMAQPVNLAEDPALWMPAVQPAPGQERDGVALFCLDGQVHVALLQGEAFLSLVGSEVMRAMGGRKLCDHGLGSSAVLSACRAAVAAVLGLFGSFRGEARRLLLVEGLLQHTQQCQRTASKAKSQGAQPSSLDELALAGELFMDVVALCHALLVVDGGCHVKLVAKEEDAILFLRVVHAKVEERQAGDSGAVAQTSAQNNSPAPEVVVLDDSDEDRDDDVVDLTADSQEL